MPRFSIELAKPSDDSDLRALATSDLAVGPIRFSLRREPSFFQAVRVQGSLNQIGVVRDTETGRAVGCGMRSVRSAYVNGIAANLGYLGGLWLDPAVRSGTLLARGYRAFHQLHRDRQALLYITTIPEEAEEARALLTSGRARLPQYDDLGRYHALAVSVGRKKRGLAGRIKVLRGVPSRMKEVEECLSRNGPRRQFFPCFLANDFLTGGPHLRDLHVKDFYLAVEDGRVVGVAAKWDQTAFRQLVVGPYRGTARVVRRVYNAGARVLGLPSMPLPGSEVKHVYLSFVAIDDDRRDVFRTLLREVYNDAAEAGCSYVFAGFHERDPLLAEVVRYRHYAHRSRLYVVFWEDGAAFHESLDGRVPYVELALL